MTGSPNASPNTTWPLAPDALSSSAARFDASCAAHANETPVNLGIRAPFAALTMMRDSARILSGFAWGKDARISRNKSAEICSLLDGWN